MTETKHDIYVRAHIVPLEEKKKKNSHENRDPRWPDYALIFDCESRLTADQTLTFGFWRFCELRDGEYVPLQEGILHDDDELRTQEFNFLRDYARARKPETTKDGCHRLRLYSRSKFIEETLGMAIQAKALIVCFNSGFDLSRLAVDWEPAMKGGWSLVLKQRYNPEKGRLEATKFFPRIIIKALNSKTAMIRSTRAPMF